MSRADVGLPPPAAARACAHRRAAADLARARHRLEILFAETERVADRRDELRVARFIVDADFEEVFDSGMGADGDDKPDVSGAGLKEELARTDTDGRGHEGGIPGISV